VLFGLTYPLVFPPIVRMSNIGNITLPGLWGADPFLVLGVFVVFVLLLFYLLERGLKRRDRLEG